MHIHFSILSSLLSVPIEFRRGRVLSAVFVAAVSQIWSWSTKAALHLGLILNFPRQSLF